MKEYRSLALSKIKPNFRSAALICFIYGLVFLAAWIVPPLIGALIIGGPLLIGFSSVIVALSKGEEVSLKTLFSGFKNVNTKIVLYISKTFYILFFTIFLIVPGIMKALSYSMSFYVLLNEPKLDASKALLKSKRIMHGHKQELFNLYLGYLPLIILGILSLGILFCWIIPLMELAKYEFYLKLKSKFDTEALEDIDGAAVRLHKAVDTRPFAEINALKIRMMSKKKKRLNRSKSGDFFLFLFLAACGAFSLLPLILTVSNAFKPLDELFLFPPRFFPRNPGIENFKDLGGVLGTSLVPFSRYFFNTIFITIMGTIGHVIFASMCAYALAKYKVPGGSFIFGLIVYSLMFPHEVTSIPNYIVFNQIGLIDTYWSMILPMISFPLGLFLMKQFMSQVPTSLIESAKIDGAGEFKIWFSIVMPLVKPAWLTLIILVFQRLWAADGSTFIYREDLKMVSYALVQISTAGPARVGVLAAVSLIMITVPITIFIISQSQIMETMAHSGMK